MIAIIVLCILLGIIAVIVILLHFSPSVYFKADRDGIDFSVKYLWFTIYPRSNKPKRAKKSKGSKTKAKRHEKKSVDKDLFDDSFDDDFDDVDIDDGENEQTAEPLADNETETAENIGESKENAVTEKQEDDKPQDKAEGKAEKKTAKKTKEKIGRKPKKDKSQSKGGKLASLKSKYEKIKPYVPMGWKYCKKLLKTVRFENLNTEVSVGRFDAHEAVIYYGAVQGALFNLLGTLAGIFTLKVKKANVNCVFNKNTIDGRVEFTLKVRPSALIAIAVCALINFLIIYLKRRIKRKKSHGRAVGDIKENTAKNMI